MDTPNLEQCLILDTSIVAYCQKSNNYVPPPWRGGHIVLSADPVGIGGGGGVATGPHSISLLNGHILAILTQIYHWEGKKMLIRFW